MNKGIADFTHLLQEHHISFVVINNLYGTHELKTVDVYVFRKDREAAKKLLAEWNDTDNTYLIGDTTFVLRDHTAIFDSKDKQTYWDDMIDDYWDELLDHVMIGDVSVPMLPPTLQAITMFVNVYNHQKNHTLTSAMMNDWKAYMKLKESEIVGMELMSKLERLGLLKAFNELKDVASKF